MSHALPRAPAPSSASSGRPGARRRLRRGGGRAGTAVALLAPALLLAGLSGIPTAGAASGDPDVPLVRAAAASTGYVHLDAVPGTKLPQTRFAATGVLAGKEPRTVKLTLTSGRTTRTIATTTSTARGTFRFVGVQAATSGKLIAVTPRQVLSVKAGPKTHARYRKAVKREALAAAKVRTRKAARAAAEERLAGVKPSTSPQRTRMITRDAAKRARQLRSARKALTRARVWLATCEASLVRQVPVVRGESSPVPVTVVPGQSSSITALPPIAQAGATAAAPLDGAVVSARFVPARVGRTVRLEKLVDGEWVSLHTQPQDRSGHAVFAVAAGATFRAVTAQTSEAEAVSTAAVTTRSYSLDFSDTFSGTSLGSDWVAQVRPRGTGLRTCARTEGSGVAVRNGVLAMGVSKDPTMGTKTCAYTDHDGVKHQLTYMRNTQLATAGAYDYRYGFAAARMKVQSATGMHSAFWSQPTHEKVAGRPDLGVEVDIMEYFGNYSREENGIASFQHVLRKSGTLEKVGRMFPETTQMKSSGRFPEQYHVFSLEWTPTSYVFRVDGREYHRTSRDVSQVPQYLLLSNLTSSYELVGLKKFDDVATVDWVQVWQ